MRLVAPHAIGLFPSRSRSPDESGAFLQTMVSGLEPLAPSTGARLGLELLSNAASRKRYAMLLQDVQAKLRDGRVPVAISERKNNVDLIPPSDLSRPQRRWLGQVALELYFTQLFSLDQALLDLRPARFGIDLGGDAIWQPRPLYFRWEPRFLSGLRDVYAGFFLGQEARMQSGLADLGLSTDGHLFLRHLGDGNQRSVRFRSSDLQTTLHDMAVHHAMDRTALHQSFAAFSLYVASLYELLEHLERAFDVRTAFMRSCGGR